MGKIIQRNRGLNFSRFPAISRVFDSFLYSAAEEESNGGTRSLLRRKHPLSGGSCIGVQCRGSVRKFEAQVSYDDEEDPDWSQGRTPQMIMHLLLDDLLCDELRGVRVFVS
ncbi:unnamed protein product [Linum tenue]|uniref:Uncharacterized protein n=1 Tax=Linum tenue TaxID=586396 RepID=A0AAV0LMP0_9ROSI|nr:unnamed protein product [Linum tenue]